MREGQKAGEEGRGKAGKTSSYQEAEDSRVVSDIKRMSGVSYEHADALNNKIEATNEVSLLQGQTLDRTGQNQFVQF